MAESGSAKARDLKLDATAFDCGEFLFKVKKLLRVGMNDRAGEEEEDDEMDAEGGRGDNWDSIGQLLGKSSRKVPSIDFM